MDTSKEHDECLEWRDGAWHINRDVAIAEILRRVKDIQDKITENKEARMESLEMRKKYCTKPKGGSCPREFAYTKLPCEYCSYWKKEEK